MDNPSVVKEDGVSNYNLTRGIKLDPFNAAGTRGYIDQLQRMSDLPVPPPQLGASDYFPGAGRGIQVGSTGTQTLGSQPIFAPTGGLLPFEVLQAYRREKISKSKSLYQQGDMDNLYPEITELSNLEAQPQWNDYVQSGIDTWLSEYSKVTGGDPLMAQKALKQDRNFQSWVKELNYIAKGYNEVFKEAEEVLINRHDPAMGYTKDQVEAAYNFVNNMNDLEVMEPAKLKKELHKFRSTVNIWKLADATTKDLGERIRNRIREHPEFSTNKSKALETVRTKGFSDEEVDDLMEAALAIYPEDLTEDQRNSLRTLIRSRADNIVESSIDSLSQDLVDSAAEARQNGVPMDDMGNIKYHEVVSSFRRDQYGMPQTGTKALTYPTKVKTPQGGAQDVEVTLRPGERFQVMDSSGKLETVYVHEPVTFSPSVEYNVNDINTVDALTDGRPEGVYNKGEIRIVEGVGRMIGQKLIPEEGLVDGSVVGDKTDSFIKAFRSDGSTINIGSNTFIAVNRSSIANQIETLMPHFYNAGEEARPNTAHEASMSQVVAYPAGQKEVVEEDKPSFWERNNPFSQKPKPKKQTETRAATKPKSETQAATKPKDETQEEAGSTAVSAIQLTEDSYPPEFFQEGKIYRTKEGRTGIYSNGRIHELPFP